EVGVRGAITISTTSADCLRAVELASQHENLWCSAGVHPLNSDEPLDWADVRAAAAHPKCVVWGELGLDNHYDQPPRPVQDKVLDFGAWISFTGVVTFPNAKEVAAAAKLVPADRIMVETDSPFLTPEPFRKVRPNEPKYVVHVARRLAELRCVDPIEFEAQLD